MQITHSLIRHSTRNFRTAKVPRSRRDQVASVALYGCKIHLQQLQQIRDILTAATDLDVNYTKPKYFLSTAGYTRIASFDSKGVADPSVEIQFWTKYQRLAGNECITGAYGIKGCFQRSMIRLRQLTSLIPSGETSSFRSNPLGLAEFCTFPEKIRSMWDVQKRSRKQRRQWKPESVRLRLYRNCRQ